MRDARHPTSPFSAQRVQQSSDATMEAAEQHSSTAAAAVKSSLRLHPKKDQKNIPGQSKIEALEAPGRLPGGSREAPGSSRAPSKQGIKTDPVPEPIPSISAAPFMLIYVENDGQAVQVLKPYQPTAPYLAPAACPLRQELRPWQLLAAPKQLLGSS